MTDKSISLGNSMASFIAEIDSDSATVAAYIAQRLDPLVRAAELSDDLRAILYDVLADDRKAP